MKKLLLFVTILSLTFASTNAQEFRIGAKGGANFASLIGDDADGSKTLTNFHIGAVAKIGISELFSLQPELVYSNQGSKGEGSDSGKLKLGYINLPIMADFMVAEGLSLQAGPQVGFNISSKVENGDGDEFDLDNVNTLDISLGIGAQYVLPINLFFQARYNVGLSNVIEDFDDGINSASTDAKNSVISVSVGYFFN